VAESREEWLVRRNLFVSPDHAIYLPPDHAVFVKYVLVPLKLLANGTSIAWVKRDLVWYFHVQLPGHAVIVAEGLPEESYLDTGDRADFDGDGKMIRRFPDFTSRLAPDATLVWETREAAPHPNSNVAMPGSAVVLSNSSNGSAGSPSVTSPIRMRYISAG
jgi:hypothetical protein